MLRNILLAGCFIWLNVISINGFCQLSGNYTIDSALVTGGTNFQSFTDFVDSLTIIGVSDAVAVKVVSGSGPYHEKIEIAAYPGMSASNPVIINGNGETISNPENTYYESIIQLDSTKHLTFENVNIEQNGFQHTIGFCLRILYSDSCYFRNSSFALIHSDFSQNGALVQNSCVTFHNSTYISINNCHVLGGGTAGIYGGITEHTTLKNNLIENGTYPIHRTGITLASCKRCEVVGNKVNNFIEEGISILSPKEDLLVSENTISSTDNSLNHYRFRAKTGLLVDLQGRQSKFTIEKNKIHEVNEATENSITNTYSVVGIHIIGDVTDSAEAIVKNNIIGDLNASLKWNSSTRNNICGLIHEGNGIDLYHNTFSLTSEVKFGSIIGIDFKDSHTLSSNCKNNIISLEATRDSVYAYGVVLEDTLGKMSFDYNDIYVESVTFSGRRIIAEVEGVIKKLPASWQATNGNAYGQNSQFVSPRFRDFFGPFETSLHGSGLDVGITEDAFGRSRDSTPDLGAFEVQCNTNPEDVLLSINSDSSLTIEWGSKSVVNGWVISFSNIDSIAANGRNIIYSDTNFISFPDIDAGNSFVYSIRAICEVGDSGFWSIPDTIYFGGVPLCGNYTIDSSLTTRDRNFQNFTDFINSIDFRGVSCPVNVSVVSGSGPYNEQIIFRPYNGVSKINTITINGNGETISYAPSSSDRRVMGFDSAKHITIDSLTIKGTSSNYGYAVHFMNNADSNVIRNCVIDMSRISNQAFDASAGIVTSASKESKFTMGSSASFLRIENNEIIGNNSGGAFAGISFVGPNSNNTGNQIVNNLIRDFYSDGIYIGNQEDMIISGNEISRPDLSNVGEGYGIFIDRGASKNLLIEKNVISNMFGGKSASKDQFFGVYISNNDATADKPVSIQNNIIHNISSDGDIHGVYNSHSDHIQCYHNTIYINDTNSTEGDVRGFYITNVTSGVDIRNNIISINRSGSGKKYGIYINTSSPSMICDYNNIDIDTLGTGGEFVGYFGGDQNGLMDWQNVNSNSFGQNSNDLEPEFTSAEDLRPTNLLLNNKGLNLEIIEDYNGSYRDSTPDVGAIEFDTIHFFKATSIAAINTININGKADSINLRYELSGTVVGVDLDSTDNLSFYMINQSSGSQEGIHVLNAKRTRYQVVEGDSLKIKGKLSQFNGLLSILTDSIKIIDKGNAIPVPILQSTLDENTESKRVELEELKVIQIATNGDLILGKGGDSIYVSINDATDIDDSLNVQSLMVGDTVCSLIGIGTQSDTTFPYTAGYRILPMYFSDINLVRCQLVGLVEKSENSEIKVIPNPTNGAVTIEFEPDKTIEFLELYKFTGSYIKSIPVNSNKIQLDLSGYATGIYFIRYEHLFKKIVVQ